MPARELASEGARALDVWSAADRPHLERAQPRTDEIASTLAAGRRHAKSREMRGVGVDDDDGVGVVRDRAIDVAGVGVGDGVGARVAAGASDDAVDVERRA